MWPIAIAKKLCPINVAPQTTTQSPFVERALEAGLDQRQVGAFAVAQDPPRVSRRMQAARGAFGDQRIDAWAPGQTRQHPVLRIFDRVVGEFGRRREASHEIFRAGHTGAERLVRARNDRRRRWRGRRRPRDDGWRRGGGRRRRGRRLVRRRVGVGVVGSEKLRRDLANLLRFRTLREGEAQADDGRGSPDL